MPLNALLELDQFTLNQSEKEKLLLSELNRLSLHHVQNCPEYAKLLQVLYPGQHEAESLLTVPYLPVGLFKRQKLLSIPETAVFKELNSSGTSGDAVSRIFLDKETARLQTQALASIIKVIVGSARLPMVILDSEHILAQRSMLTARATAILGMMNFGRDHFFALDKEMKLDHVGLENYLLKHKGKKILIYGFTFMVWQYFCKQIVSGQFDLSDGVLVHSGGWKKLTSEQVSAEDFKEKLRADTGLSRVFNFYGMVEQVGSIFLEAEDGFFYAPNFADVIIRDHHTWRECEVGEPGVVQVLSALPHSYPGHSILTEDLGVVLGIDDSSCNRGGKRFSILGRVPKAVLRGCSDVHAFETARV